MAEIIRKIWHILICLISLGIYINMGLFFGIYSLLLGLIILKLLNNTSMIRMIRSVRGSNNHGEVYIFLGLMISYILSSLLKSQINATAIGVLTLAFGDTVASLFKNRIINSLILLICFWIIFELIGGQNIGLTFLLTSLGLLITNYYSRGGTDNLTIANIIIILLTYA